VLDGGANLSVACRNRQLRYCDTGDVAPAVPGLRVAMLGELLGISSWQPVETGNWRRCRRTGPGRIFSSDDPGAQTQRPARIRR